MYRSLFIAASFFAASLVHANEVNPIYAGAALGTSTWKPSCNASFCDRERGVAGKAWLGYQFGTVEDNKLLSSVEATYFNSGVITEGPADSRHSTHVTAFGLSYKAAYKVGAFGMHARGGVAAINNQVSYGTAQFKDGNKFGFTYGIGASYQVNENVSVVLDADKLRNNRVSAPIYTVGVNYKFK